KVLGMVNSADGFGDHPKVINGFSDLMVEVFGEAIGKHARSAVGMGGLPVNIPVEIEMVLEVEGGHGAPARSLHDAPLAGLPLDRRPRRRRGDPRLVHGRRRAVARLDPAGQEEVVVGSIKRGSTRRASAIRGPCHEKGLPSTRWIRPSRTAGTSAYPV